MDPDQPLFALHLLVVALCTTSAGKSPPLPGATPSGSSWDLVRNRARSIQRPYSRYQDRHTQYRGVSYDKSGGWEAHMWHQGYQLQLGTFDHKIQAACAHDVAALKFKGQDARTNFPLSLYEDAFVHWNMMSEKELLERLQQVCSPGCSKYVGVNKDKTSEKWEARYPLPMEKHGDGPTCMDLGLHTLEIDAAKAYDQEAIRRIGRSAVTNFGISHYSELLAKVEATGSSSSASPADSNDP